MSTVVTGEQYSAIERQAETKSEFHDGEMFAMAGGSRNHAHPGGMVFALLKAKLPAGCMPFGSDMQIRLAATGQQTCADCGVVRGQAQPEGEDDIVENPILIVEVLSPSTEAYDRGRKFESYQDRRRVEHFSKLGDGNWNLRISIRYGRDGANS